ncbi:G-patch domain-containing protein [Forsythia ovata]|uniref:G-patch domain-containing protein n=1 Tax=Forsythia ovata TaxID=205694 RepID=A0ABD1R389_9LAMI
MAGTEGPQETDCTFRWDEDSQLYYHASTGFYHEPQAGWYYSSIDGLYYKFENGNYVLLESNQVGDQSELNNANCEGEASGAEKEGAALSAESSLDRSMCINSDQSEYPPPASEWLEDTLINMYLSGYSDRSTHAATSDIAMSVETNDSQQLNLPADVDDDIQELEEGEWIPDEPHCMTDLSSTIVDDGISLEEENWRAQYGQVTQPSEEWMLDLHTVDLWDWALVKGIEKDGKSEVSRLVGRLKKRSSKLHPSISSARVKTAPVCEVHFDMVRVTSGQVYRLRIPSSQYLTSLSVYDASNPTKNWGFPQLSINKHMKKIPKYGLKSESESSEGLAVQTDQSLSSEKLCSSKKDHVYRDRASERRALHGGFGIGPEQKTSLNSSDYAPSSPISLHPEEAAVESLSISFGAGSYARKILESMGWKEGEALGRGTNGLIEPLQAIGNKGNAGLGWDDGRKYI